MAAIDLSIPKLFGVEGKIALVTGGASGLGKMIATTLVNNGARVIISSRKEKELVKAVEELNAAGPGKCEYAVSDLSTRAGCDALAETIKTKLSISKLDILINNSGVTWGGPYADFPEKSGWDKIFALNVKSVFYLTAALTPLLIEAAKQSPDVGGRVVNIGSISGLDPKVEMGSTAGDDHTGAWSYAPSKAAVHHLTRVQAVHLGPHKITVNAVLPGFFPSKMTAFVFDVLKPQLEAAQPNGRLGQPEDIGGIVMFLVSPAGAHVTGNAIVIDGGALIAGKGGFDLDISEPPAKSKL